MITSNFAARSDVGMTILQVAETFGITLSEIFDMTYEEFFIAREMIAGRNQRRNSSGQSGGLS